MGGRKLLHYMYCYTRLLKRSFDPKPKNEKEIITQKAEKTRKRIPGTENKYKKL